MTNADSCRPNRPATTDEGRPDGSCRTPVDKAAESLGHLVVQHRRGDALCPEHIAAVVEAACELEVHPVLERFVERVEPEPEAPATMIEACEVPEVVVHVLGGFECRVHGVAIEKLPSTVVALLSIVASHDTVAVEVVIDALWPDVSEEVGRRRLRNVISRARKVVGSGAIIRTNDWLQLGADVASDRREFQERAADAAAVLRSGKEPAGPLIVDALDHYGGPFLPGRPYWEWASTLRIELHSTAVGLFDALLRDQAYRPAAAWSLETAARISIQDPALYVLIAADAAVHAAPATARAAISAAEVLSADLGVALEVCSQLSASIEALERSTFDR